MEQLIYKRIVEGEEEIFAFLYYIVEQDGMYRVKIRSIGGDGRQRWATGHRTFEDYLSCLRVLNLLYKNQVGPIGLREVFESMWE